MITASCSPEGSLFEPQRNRKAEETSLLDLLIEHYDRLITLTELTERESFEPRGIGPEDRQADKPSAVTRNIN